MEYENIRTLLKNSVLGDLPPEEIDQLARTVEVRDTQPHEAIYKEGNAPDAFYIVGSGHVRIFVTIEGRIERELSVRGPGAHFGELALLTGEALTASATSVDQAQLIVLTKEQFGRLMRDHPEFYRRFMRQVRRWLLRDQEIVKEGADEVIKSSRMGWFDLVLIFGISVLLAVTFNISNPNGIPFFPQRPDPEQSISAVTARAGYQKGKILIVDAMPANFYQLEHIKSSINMPMAIFNFVYLMSFSKVDKDKEIVVYGHTISRPYDLQIAEKLRMRGYRNVKVLRGGLKAWEAHGYPVAKGASE